MSNVKCIYAGKRVRGGKVYQLFFENGKERYQKGIKRVAIGYTYFADKNSMPRQPHRDLDAPRASDEQVERWEAEEACELVSKKRDDAERKLASDSKLWKKLDPVLIELKKLKTYSARRAFIEACLDRAEGLSKKGLKARTPAQSDLDLAALAKRLNAEAGEAAEELTKKRSKRK